MVGKNNHNGENWPYHLYEGNKPELQGSYVPCSENPCGKHGGSEVYATSPDAACAKAHKNDSFGMSATNANTDNSTNDKQMLTTLDIHTNETVAVQPVAVYGSDTYDTLLIVDARTGNGIWMGANPSQWLINLGRGDSHSDAERVEDIYGEDEDEWDATADSRLAAYGFRLGEYHDTDDGGYYDLLRI